MDGFEQSEQEGRDLFTKFCEEKIIGCKIIKFAKDKHSSWDVAYQIDEFKFIGEIKKRDYDANAFDDWFLEKSKFDGMTKIREKIREKTNLTYICFFNNNETKIFDITKINEVQESISILLPQTTKGKTTKVRTEVYKCNEKNESFVTLGLRLNKELIEKIKNNKR